MCVCEYVCTYVCVYVCMYVCVYVCKLDFCLTVHHQLGKIIQMNQLDETMIY